MVRHLFRRIIIKTKNALILGGGGQYGSAWELGYIRGLEEGSVQILKEVDTVVGTSAG